MFNNQNWCTPHHFSPTLLTQLLLGEMCILSSVALPTIPETSSLLTQHLYDSVRYSHLYDCTESDGATRPWLHGDTQETDNQRSSAHLVDRAVDLPHVESIMTTQ